MPCKVTGVSYYDCDFESHSGKSANDQDCTIHSGDTGVLHIVKVIPTRKKFHDIRVTGIVVADPSTAKAEFSGPTVLANNIEWQETKQIDVADIYFDSAEIRFVKAGSENVKTLVEEKSRWSHSFNRIDQNDLTFTITLS